jgi:3-hydroxy acid dehydrogenase/malonic semialdehyde reductase
MSKRVLITGATSGIGEACAKIFAKQKYDLILTGRREERLKKLAAGLQEKYGIKIQTIILDVRNKEEVERKLENLSDEWKVVDILINNAGLSLGLDPIQNGSIEDWEIMIDTNIKGLLYVTKVVCNWMIKREQGHIVNVGSLAGKETYANGNVYCATKHAVDSLNKAMRIDLLQYNIRVTAINPGAVETEFSEIRFKGDKERAKKVYEGFKPLVADDIADLIWFATSRSPHVNITEMLVTPTAQANTTHLKRNTDIK